MHKIIINSDRASINKIKNLALDITIGIYAYFIPLEDRACIVFYDDNRGITSRLIESLLLLNKVDFNMEYVI